MKMEREDKKNEKLKKKYKKRIKEFNNNLIIILSYR